MSMNIASMLRAMMGEAQADGARALELRVGQIVRGVLLEMLDNHEALMNINGVQVRAKLEAPLPAGTASLFQVQPGSHAAAITLKPLTESGDRPAEDSIRDVLKSFGLPDRKWSLELMRALKRDGYPIGKDTAAYFQTAAGVKPAGPDMQSWIAAADVAFRRGLPATQDTLGALRQALFGPPMHEQIADLSSALQAWQDAGAGKSSPAQQLVARLQALLPEGEKLFSEGQAQLEASAERPVSAGKPIETVGTRQAAAEPGQTRLSPNAPATAPASGTVVMNSAALAMPSTDVDPAGEGTGGAASKGAVTSGTAGEARQVPQGNQDSALKGQTVVTNTAPRKASSTGREPPVLQPAVQRGDSPWIGRFLQWLGVDHEHGLVRSVPEGLHSDQALLFGLTQGGGSGEGSTQEAARAASDTLKSVLLSLAAHEETPPALREAAQSLVTQITGQQLLLSSERQSNAPYSWMTLFVPMKGQDGQSTAAVHVQTRRGRRGEWDADNCRLLFDLRMRNLGDTVVDVQVTDRIVSVKLMNEFPGMPALVEHAKDELSSALQSAGFHLLSMTAAPLPSYKKEALADASNVNDLPGLEKSASYAGKKYKGVDYRI